MITIQEIETALNNAGWQFIPIVHADFENMKLIPTSKLSKQRWHESWSGTEKYDYILPEINCIDDLLGFCEEHECYFFKKQCVEYGTIDYGINELIEDLRTWL